MLAQITAITQCGSYKLLKVILHEPDGFQFFAGQYTTLTLITPEKFFGYYSIASSPLQLPEMEFCIVSPDQEAASNAGSEFNLGDSIRLSRPETLTFADVTQMLPTIMIAGGSGIAPFRSLITAWSRQSQGGLDIHLIYGCHSKDAMPYVEELVDLSNQIEGFKISLCASDGSSVVGNVPIVQGLVTDCLANEFLKFQKNTQILLCGPPKMIQAVELALTHKNVDPQCIKKEG